jgi:potassium-transporting ATPase KdpC subunit
MRDMIMGALRFSIVSWILCGVLYPLLATVFAQLLFPFQANGSLVKTNGTIIASRFVGQNWSGGQWFHGWPSATLGNDPNDPEKSIAQPYNASNSGASNLGPTSKELAGRLLADRRAFEIENPKLANQLLPADILTTSASGLDPDISIANARLQAARVVTKRSISEGKLQALIERCLSGRALGIFGEPRVNVLELNLALEHAFLGTAAGKPDLR